MDQAGQRSAMFNGAGDWASSFQHCLFTAAAASGHRAKQRGATQLSPELKHDGRPRACGGSWPQRPAVPVEGLLPELEKTAG